MEVQSRVPVELLLRHRGARVTITGQQVADQQQEHDELQDEQHALVLDRHDDEVVCQVAQRAARLHELLDHLQGEGGFAGVGEGERGRERESESVCACLSACVCARESESESERESGSECVCVRERERERDRREREY